MTNHKISLLLCLAALALFTHADEFEWSELGLRIGISDENRADVNSYEIIATLESPWSREISDSLELDLEF